MLFCWQSYYFDRDDVALPGFAKYFKDASDEEREHAEKFMKYQNKRGGRIVLQDIKVLVYFLISSSLLPDDFEQLTIFFGEINHTFSSLAGE